MRRLIIHAPSVHVGGGGVLLKALMAAPNLGDFVANLDARALALLKFLDTTRCYFVQPTLGGRFQAEWRLFRLARDEDIVLCFHGLPPIFPVRGRVVVFKQNTIHLVSNALSAYPKKTQLRLSIERLICKMFCTRVQEYIVQTPSMKLAVQAWDKGSSMVSIIPFLDGSPGYSRNSLLSETLSSGTRVSSNDGEFIYVADGEAHKNHSSLISAWELLASEGLFPRLVLTLPERSARLWQEIEGAIAAYGLQIFNLGTLKHEEILMHYQAASALIFPSKTESFGLPLIEAQRTGLPIIASELDYVRDVCMPCETFDPASPRSIAAAVKRFLNIPSSLLKIRTPAEFVAEITSF